MARRKPKPKRASVAVIVHEDEAAQVPAPVAVKPKHTMTAADRRNWLRRQAGWPAEKVKETQ